MGNNTVTLRRSSRDQYQKKGKASQPAAEEEWEAGRGRGDGVLGLASHQGYAREDGYSSGTQPELVWEVTVVDGSVIAVMAGVIPQHERRTVPEEFRDHHKYVLLVLIVGVTVW